MQMGNAFYYFLSQLMCPKSSSFSLLVAQKQITRFANVFCSLCPLYSIIPYIQSILLPHCSSYHFHYHLSQHKVGTSHMTNLTAFKAITHLLGPSHSKSNSITPQELASCRHKFDHTTPLLTNLRWHSVYSRS